MRHSPNPRLTTLVGDRSPPRFAQLRSNWLQISDRGIQLNT
ncbi:MAG: hypothetical protein ORN98_01370 [Alphaproteobacteria bacterium]|nr:hypothetical protein [Alphaproteobacteria bacterium]